MRCFPDSTTAAAGHHTTISRARGRLKLCEKQRCAGFWWNMMERYGGLGYVHAGCLARCCCWRRLSELMGKGAFAMLGPRPSEGFFFYFLLFCCGVSGGRRYWEDACMQGRQAARGLTDSASGVPNLGMRNDDDDDRRLTTAIANVQDERLIAAGRLSRCVRRRKFFSLSRPREKNPPSLRCLLH